MRVLLSGREMRGENCGGETPAGVLPDSAKNERVNACRDQLLSVP